MYASTVSCSWASSDEVHPAVAVQIDRHQLDAAGARIDRVSRERRLEGLAVRFSRIATCPVFRHPNAATARSILPSPLKSAASTLATGPAIEPERAELPLRQPRIQITALRRDRRKELAHLGHQQILDAVLVDVRDGGPGAECWRPQPGRPWPSPEAAEDQPLTHVRAQQIELPVSVEIDQPHVRDRRVPGIRESQSRGV